MRLMSGFVVALALAGGAALAAAVSVEPVEGGYKGRTAQGLPVYFGVREGRVVNTRFTFRWSYCGKHTAHEARASLEIDAAGHFLLDEGRSQFEGTFVAPDRVEGMVIVPEHPLAGCPLREIPFVAQPRSTY
jgi:hypothetical protein